MNLIKKIQSPNPSLARSEFYAIHYKKIVKKLSFRLDLVKFLKKTSFCN